MNLKKMMIGSALLMAACCMQAQTKAIAHRGFWKTNPTGRYRRYLHRRFCSHP